MKFFLGSVRQWHWISSAICLVGMLLFAITGITLNNAASIPAKPHVQTVKAVVPEAVLRQLAVPSEDKAPLPEVLIRWLQQYGVNGAARLAEWSPEEIYLSLPRAGGDAWLSIDLSNGEMLYEKTDRGWISWLNDLHKGRNTGSAWSWFIDIFSISCIIFCVTGLILLYRHAEQRRSTWPMVGLGVVVPWVLIILFMH